jgi:hypothetical protein
VTHIVRNTKSLLRPLNAKNYSIFSSKSIKNKTKTRDHDPKSIWNKSSAASPLIASTNYTESHNFIMARLLSTEANKKEQHSIDRDPSKFTEHITEDETLEITSNIIEEDTVTGADGTQVLGRLDPNRKLTMVFTCNVCNTRSAKQFSWLAYYHGVVLVTCPGCDNKHLIADRLHWFDGMSVEDYLANKGQTVTKAQEFEESMLDGISAENKQEILDAWAGKDKEKKENNNNAKNTAADPKDKSE